MKTYEARLEGEHYEALVEDARRDFVKKNVVVECLYGEGEPCEASCPQFGRCWIKGRLEETAVSKNA